MIKNIIFDLGGVIVMHPATVAEEILCQMFPQLTMDRASKIWLKHKIPLNTGRQTSLEFMEDFKHETCSKLSKDELLEQWVEFYKEKAKIIDENVLGFVDELKKRYEVYAFTDTIDVHDDHNSKRGIYEHFKKVFRSYKIGVAKSEGKMAFEYLLKKIKAKPDECLFIDDVEANIKSAKAARIGGIVYKNLKQLKRELESQGIS